ncbi:ABC transporter permease [Methylococcus sp. EFPC2]|uniref:ABC transporter permease n=1 Tax=Methylococcus sp. EFPC2 TaxID=2812648 RepID=UPI001967D25F|nr:FtsX-like permease family protein [Methylococcus sp. EFPC2]QSA97627.1 FtsX-like permease family protein [Methylococcus sp. EFPC2]
MTHSPTLALAWKLLRRDWRSGELSLLLTALIIAVAGVTAVSLLGHRMNRTMTAQAAEFMAADLLVRARELPPADWFARAESLRLRHARLVEFPSVLVEGDEILLCGIKAAGPGYPLRGALKTRDSVDSEESLVTEGPPPGEAWVEQRVLATLHLAIGGTLTVGEKRLTVTRILTHEPDRRGELFSLSPRVMINLADLDATGVIRPGSNVQHYALFAGDEAAVREFNQWIRPTLHPGQRLTDVHEDRPEIGNALTRAERYLGLSSVVIVLIAGVAIAMSARRYGERHFDQTALLKCLGATENQVLILYLAQFLLIGLLGGLLGCLAGWGAQEGLATLLRRMLPNALAAPAWYAALFGPLAGLLVLLGFALPPVLRLKRLSPLRVLRRDLDPLPSSALSVYGLALLTLALLVWRFTGDGRLTALSLGGGAAALALVGALAWVSLKSLAPLIPKLALSWRFGWQNLTRRPKLGVSQIVAFSLTLTAMQLSVLARSELMQEWRSQLPVNAPNHFALNLFETDLPAFKSFLAQEGIEASRIYPIVRGRLTAINGADAHGVARRDTPGEGAINRDLSLTWATELPPDNRITAGNWPGASAEPTVSVEAKLAESLNIRLGDRLTFNLAGQILEAQVDSLRSVRWDTMNPNFYMIFPPGVLDGYPATYLTSFHLPAERKAWLTQLVKTFPAITLLEVDVLLSRFQSIILQVSLAIQSVLVLALLAGFTVLFAAVRASLDDRLREDALLRAMGAARKLLNRSVWTEFMTLGFLSGFLATAMTELLAWILFSRIFDLVWRPHPLLWLATPVLSAVVVGVCGYLNSRAVVRTSPAAMLRDAA